MTKREVMTRLVAAMLVKQIQRTDGMVDLAERLADDIVKRTPYGG